MSELNITLLRKSFQRLAPRADELARRFYERLFADFPELEPLFAKTDFAEQRQKLVRSLTVIVRSLEKPEGLIPYLQLLGAEHVHYGVQEEDYPKVAAALSQVMAELLGEDWTPEVGSAWEYALEFVAKYMRAGRPKGERRKQPVREASGAKAVRESSAAVVPAVSTLEMPETPVESSAPLVGVLAPVSINQSSPSGPVVSEESSMPASSKVTPAQIVPPSGSVSGGLPAEQLLGILDLSPIGSMLVGADGQIAYANHQALEIVQQLSEYIDLNAEALVGSPAQTLFDAIPELGQAAANLRRKQEVQIKAGNEWLRIDLIPLQDAAGKRAGSVLQWHLITAEIAGRKQHEEATENQAAIGKVMAAIGAARSPEEGIRAALGAVRDAFGWAYGSFWKLDNKDRTLKFAMESGSVNSEFRRVTESASFAEGVGLSGRAWRQKELVFVEDLGKVTDCVRAPIAQSAGVKSGICFPIIVQGNVVGTMDFFALETLSPSQDRLQTLRNVGRLVSMNVEIFESSQSVSMVENMPINVMLASRDFDLVYMNQSSRKTLKSIEHLLPRPVDQLVGQKIDIFHKNPEHQRRMLADSSRLPHRAKINVGPETLDLLVSAVTDKAGNYVGPMVTWTVVTQQIKMADDFEREVKGVVQIVTESAGEMQGSAGTMAAAAEETARQSQVVAAASEETTRNVETVSSAAEELSASISEIARHVQEASKISSQAVQEAQSTNKKIKELGDSSQQIGQVIKVITSIAQQTNLLALNATIEAARAGEAGKGFAVVANEVKELARQTAKATEEISQKISAIQGATGEAIDAIGVIGQTIGKINEISTTIASAVEEQSAATNEISRNVSEAAKGTSEVSSNIAGMSQAAVEAGKTAGDLQAAATGLSQESSRLDRVTSEFLARLRSV